MRTLSLVMNNLTLQSSFQNCVRRLQLNLKSSEKALLQVIFCSLPKSMEGKISANLKIMFLIHCGDKSLLHHSTLERPRKIKKSVQFLSRYHPTTAPKTMHSISNIITAMNIEHIRVQQQQWDSPEVLQKVPYCFPQPELCRALVPSLFNWERKSWEGVIAVLTCMQFMFWI